MNFRHNIFAIDENRCSLRCAQRHVQHRPPLGYIDLFAAEHRIHPCLQSRFSRQLKQQLERFIGYAILRVVEKQADRFGRQALATTRIAREQLSQMQAAHLFVVRLQCRPGFPFAGQSIALTARRRAFIVGIFTLLLIVLFLGLFIPLLLGERTLPGNFAERREPQHQSFPNDQTSGTWRVLIDCIKGSSDRIHRCSTFVQPSFNLHSTRS